MTSVSSKYAQAVLADSPVAYYRFNELVSPALDSSAGTAFNATWASGNIQAGQPGALYGDTDRSIRFTSTSGPVDPPTITGLSNTAAAANTFEFWFKWDGVLTNTAMTIIGLNGTPNFEIRLSQNASAAWYLGIWTAALATSQYGVPWPTLTRSNVGNWHHVVMTIVNNQSTGGAALTQFYIDGVSQSPTLQGTFTTRSIDNANILIGSNAATTTEFSGNLDEVAFYAGTLAPARILAHYNAGIALLSGLVPYLPGIESIVEFNGLQLNDHRTSRQDFIRVKEIGGLDDADVRDTREPNPSRSGEATLTSMYGGRTITLGGTIEAYSFGALRRLQQQLRGAFQDTSIERDLTLHNPFDNTMDVRIPAKKSANMQMAESQSGSSLPWRDFNITMRSTDYRFTSVTQMQATLFSGSATVTLTNLGTANEHPIIVFTGDITSPVLTNSSTGKAITLTGQITAGSVYTVDCVNRTITDGSGASKVATMTAASDWPFFQPGANVLTLTQSAIVAASARVDIYWRHAL